MANIRTIEKLEPRQIRHNLGMNQLQFWSAIGVTQSGGSRYESGRSMPKPVRELLRLVYVERLDHVNFKREDQYILDYLKSYEPALYKSLKKMARAGAKAQEMA